MRNPILIIANHIQQQLKMLLFQHTFSELPEISVRSAIATHIWDGNPNHR
jgi:hypothetical protein